MAGNQPNDEEFEALLRHCQQQVLRQFGFVPEVKPIGMKLVTVPKRRRVLFDF